MANGRKKISALWRRLLNCSSRLAGNGITSTSGVEVFGGNSNSFGESTSAKLSPRLRYVFIIVAFIFLAIAAFILLLVLVNHGGDTQTPEVIIRQNTGTIGWILWRLKSTLDNHRSAVIFLATTFALFQFLAIGAAIFNWPVVLFSYVIITGIFGTIVGVIGIVGIIFTCILMRHDSHKDHTITITVAIVISLVFIFYLMTILGVRLMDYFQRRNLNRSSSYKNPRSIYNRIRLRKQQKQRKMPPTSIYRSIGPTMDNCHIQMDVIDLEDDDQQNQQQDEQQLTQISLLSTFTDHNSSMFDHQV